MCGICGAIQIRGEARPLLAPDRLDAMVDMLAHRGPDDRGTVVRPGAALGVRRLSIVDVAGGHQPFANEDGTVVAIQNGELYEHDALRGELLADGHRFVSRCDTEVIPHLYERHGTSFPRRLRGMFGIAVWDARRRRGVLARDRLGIKPLLYAECGDVLLFASELKSLLRSGLVDTALDHDAIDAYLALGFFPAPATPLRAVRKLPPGHVLVVEDGGVRLEQYWAYPHPAPRRDLSRQASAELVLASLDEAVRLRLMADVPLGAMLSGGLDSTLVTALMARHTTGAVRTFSVGFVDGPAPSELGVARRVASALGTHHEEVELRLADEELDLEELVWQLDEPVADLSSVGFLALSELAARHVKVALSGQGADELFGGYARHGVARRAEQWWSLPAGMRAAAAAAARVAGGRVRDGVDRLQRAPDAAALAALQRRLDRPSRHGLTAHRLRPVGASPAEAAIADRLAGLDASHLPATLVLDARLGLVDDLLGYFDHASMAHSLEVRVPFLDHHVVELAAGIPPAHKVHGRELKAVLRRAARGVVPDEVLARPKVGFFDGAAGAWLDARAGAAVADRLLVPHPALGDVLDPQAVRRIALRGSGGGRAPLLLALLLLEVWLTSFLPRALDRRPSLALRAG